VSGGSAAAWELSSVLRQVDILVMMIEQRRIVPGGILNR